MKINPLIACDFYKVGHKFQYPVGTTKIYSNFTPRSNRLAPQGIDGEPIEKVVFLGLQGFIKWFLIDTWNTEFFQKPKNEVVGEYAKLMAETVGPMDVSHIAALHDVGYLPIEIKALEEGSLVDMRVPVLTITNTMPEFYWIPNYLETALSAELWKVMTSATTAFEYKKILTRYAEETGSPIDFVMWQGHDFSLRGLSGLHDGANSGIGHLASFLGTDTIPAIEFAKKYYFGGFVGGSVAASEHSVMCAGGEADEYETYRHLIQDVYPSGVVSLVSDTWDYWNILTNTLPKLKDIVLARKPNDIGLAKVVIRPDSGDPVKIVCGDPEAPEGSPENKGSIELLWDAFGGTITDKGFKVLNERVGLIYGDSITLDRAKRILRGLKLKGFASCNIVFGIGSFTYQYATRDTYGFAMKATYAEVNGTGRELFKDPKTDNGTKKSAKGLLRVEKEGGEFVLYDQQTPNQETQGELRTVFKNGLMTKSYTFDEIRARLATYL